jgi:hypothetical protein
MGNKQRTVLNGLISITSVLVASLFSIMAAFRYGNSFPALVMLFIIVWPVSLLSFTLSLVLLPLIVWRGVTTYGMDKMEAWWWLSIPYSVAFPLSMVVFRMQEFGHPLALFVLLYMIATVSSAMWMLASIYKLTTSQTNTLTLKKAIMLGLVIIAGALLIAMRATPGR